MLSKKIVFIGDANSIHLKKWISFFKKDFDIKIISDTPVNSSNKKYWNQKKIKVYDFNVSRGVIKKFLNIFRKIYAYNKIIIENKRSLFHYHFISLNVIFSLPALFFIHKRIATFWGSDYNCANFLQKNIIKLVSRVFEVITSDTKEILIGLQENYKVPVKKLFYINHGIETEIFKPKGEKTPIEKEFIIFSPRALKPFYNHHLLRNNIETFKSQLPSDKFRLKFIKYNEDPSYYNILLNLQKKYPHIIEILPTLSQERLAEEYRKSHIVLSIPNKDGLPVTLLESIFTITPILGINTLDYRRILPQNLLINSFEEAVIFEYIIKIFRNYERYLNQIKDIRSKIFEQFDYHFNMQKMKSIYLQLLK